MIGYRPGPWMKYCWAVVTPLLCIVSVLLHSRGPPSLPQGLTVLPARPPAHHELGVGSVLASDKPVSAGPRGRGQAAAVRSDHGELRG